MTSSLQHGLAPTSPPQPRSSPQFPSALGPGYQASKHFPSTGSAPGLNPSGGKGPPAPSRNAPTPALCQKGQVSSPTMHWEHPGDARLCSSESPGTCVAAR